MAGKRDEYYEANPDERPEEKKPTTKVVGNKEIGVKRMYVLSKKLRVAITKYASCGDWEEAAKFAGFRNVNNCKEQFDAFPEAQTYLEFIMNHNDDSVGIGIMMVIDGAIQDGAWGAAVAALRLQAEMRGLIGRARVLEPVSIEPPENMPIAVHAGPSLKVANGSG